MAARKQAGARSSKRASTARPAPIDDDTDTPIDFDADDLADSLADEESSLDSDDFDLDLSSSPTAAGASDGVSLVALDLEDDAPSPSDSSTTPFHVEAKQELGAVLKQLHAQADRAAARFKTNTDCDYFVCLVFLSHEQKEAFMQANNWHALSSGSRYVNGVALARRMKIDMPEAAYAPFEPAPPPGGE